MSSETIQILLVDDDADTRAAYEAFFSFDSGIRFQGLNGGADTASPDLSVDQALLLLIDYRLGSERFADQWLAAFRHHYGLESSWPPMWQGYLLAEDDAQIIDRVQEVKRRFGLQGILKKPVPWVHVTDLIKALHGSGNGAVPLSVPQHVLDQDTRILIDATKGLGVVVRIFREADLHVWKMDSLNPAYSNSAAMRADNQWSDQDRNALQRLLSRMRSSGVRRKSSLEFQGGHWWRRRLFKTGNGYLWLSTERLPEPDRSSANRLFGDEDRLWELDDEDHLRQLTENLTENLETHHGITRFRLYEAFPLAGLDQHTPQGTDYLYLPYWQHGGGFTGRDGTEARWLRQFADPEHFRPPDDEASKRHCWLTSRRDGQAGVDHGNAPNKVIWTIINDQDELVGVLVLDRRDDHLGWRDESWERQITPDELGAMMALLRDINGVLVRFLEHKRATRDYNYEQQRSMAQTNALRKGDPEQGVTQLLGDLTKAVYREGYAEQFQVMLLEDQGRGYWRAWNGHWCSDDGEWPMTSDTGNGNVSREYSIDQLAGMVPTASSTNTQWLCHQQLTHDARRGDGLPQSGALLSLRVPLGDAQSALVLIHQPVPNQFTQAFVERWCVNLLRLQPLLCWNREADRSARRWIISAFNHELREPIQRALSEYDLAAAGMTQPGDVPAVQVAPHTLRYLQHVIENMLAYSRDMPAQSGTADLRSVLDKTIETLRIYYRNKPLPANPIAEVYEVQASESIVSQLLFNLLDNACKYSSGAIRLHWTAPELRLDNPLKEAINQAELERWCMANERGHATSTARGGGIGLTVMRRLAELNGIDWHMTLEDQGRRLVNTLRFDSREP